MLANGVSAGQVLMMKVSEDQGLPIGHAREIALTTAFVLGGNR